MACVLYLVVAYKCVKEGENQNCCTLGTQVNYIHTTACCMHWTALVSMMHKDVILIPNRTDEGL